MSNPRYVILILRPWQKGIITLPVVAMTREVIIVESHNNSYEDNTTSSFKVRLPRELVFDQPHQIGLVDVSIPNTIFNIQPNNFFILSIFEDQLAGKKVSKGPPAPGYRSKPYSSPTSAGKTPSNIVKPSKFSKISKTPDSLLARVKLTVKVSILPGFYSEMKKLLTEIRMAISRVVKDQNLRLTKVPLIYEVRENHFFKNGQEGWFVSAEIGEYHESLKKSFLDFSFNRISFRSSMGMLSFKPSKSKDLINTVCYHFSNDIGLVWGFPTSQSRVLLSPATPAVQYAPNLARIQAEDTIYLYCAQLRNSIVSNFEVPILRCLPFSSRKLGFGDVYFQEFANQVYQDLTPQRLYNLEFELRNNRGELIQFEAGSKPVRLTLKIMPKQSY